MKVIGITAMDPNGVIGNNDGGKYTIPWRSKEDMQYFKKVTMGLNKNMRNAVIVGRNTYFTFPKDKETKTVPLLPGRLNCVLTSKPESIPKHKVLSLITIPSFFSLINRCKIQL